MLPSLPNELWLEIFRWVTIIPRDIYASHYSPFCDSPAFANEGTPFQVKCALVLVCRLWRALATEFLYKDLKILQGPCQLALQKALSEQGYGKLVRSALLPYDTTVTNHWSHSSLTVKILEACCRLEVLIRPRTFQYAMRTLTFEFDAESVTLPSLKRLEWWHNDDAERSGGINSLAGILEHALNIEYLFIGGATGMQSLMLQSNTLRLCLPHLETLRLYAVSGFILHQICTRLALPSLSHVVVDCVVNHGELQKFWEWHGENLKTVEFGKHMRFLMNDEVTPYLQSCPRAQAINYHIFFTAPPHFDGSHNGVQTVALHAAMNAAVDIWQHLEQHFNFLLGPSLPSLQQISLFGQWSTILEDVRFNPFKEALFLRHCSIDIILT